jgi:hypothetical protein
MNDVTDILQTADTVAQQLQRGLDQAQANENGARDTLASAKAAVLAAQNQLRKAMEDEKDATAALSRASAIRYDWQTRAQAFQDRMTAVNREIQALQQAAGNLTK